MTDNERNAEIVALNKKAQKLSNELQTARLRVRQLLNNRPEKILNRSSVEAYFGMIIGLLLAVIPLHWWVHAILFVGLSYLVFQVSRSITYKLSKFWRICFPLIFLCLTIAGGTKNVIKQYRDESLPTPPVRYLLFWGRSSANNPLSPNAMESKVTVDGRLLQKFAKHYELMAVCLGYDQEEDIHDVPNISKSRAFEIADQPIDMRIPWNEKFIENRNEGHIGTVYIVFLIPKGLSTNSFNTMREAMDQGAIELDHAMGPP